MRGNIPPSFSAFKILGGKDKKKGRVRNPLMKLKTKKIFGVSDSAVEYKKLIMKRGNRTLGCTAKAVRSSEFQVAGDKQLAQ